MELRHLVTLQAVLRAGSFHGAARALRLAQPTVTLHVQELESELGVELFDRRGRRRNLTPAGELLAARALPILDGVDTLARSAAELREGAGGELHLGAIEPAASRLVTPAIARLMARRPRLRARLEVGGTGSVCRGVAERRFDLGLASAPPTELELRFEPLFDEAMALAVPARHRLARLPRLAAADLEGQPLLVTEHGCAYRRTLETALLQHGVEALWAIESGSIGVLVEAARRGLGVAVVPRRAVPPTSRGIRLRRLTDVELALPVGLVTRRDGPAPQPALALLLAALRRNAGASPMPAHSPRTGSTGSTRDPQRAGR